MAEPYRAGTVALVGRPNVGKSTLLNRLVGQKVSIVTPKPQTTRHIVTGILTTPVAQAVFVDTPGLHGGGRQAINRYMNRAAAGAVGDADLVVVVVEAGKLTDEDDAVLARAAHANAPVGLVVNKVDRITDKLELLPFLDALSKRLPFAFVLPVSAETGDNCDALEREILARLPDGEPLYPEDQVTNRNLRFLAAEIVREKLMLRLRDEVPYGLTVSIERFDEDGKVVEIGAVVWVGRAGHKGIVIGRGGAMLKDVGSAARRDLEALLERPVNLKLWVKVREGWADDESALHRFGYE